MSDVTWTSDQQKVINLRDRNILVAAAAGSGKTAVLVERIIQLVTAKENPVDIDRLLVVTFTKAAAGEMRERVGIAMEKRLAGHPEDSRLQRQLALLHRAQITTIDSFCQNIIRNYFHVIGLDPTFRVADDTEIRILRQQVLDEVLESCYQEADQDFLTFADMFSTGRDDSAIERLIQSLADMALSAPWPEDWLDQVVSGYQCDTPEELESKPWLLRLVHDNQEMLSGFLKQARYTKKCCEKDGPAEYIPAITSDIEELKKCITAKTYQEQVEKLGKLQKQKLSRSKADPDQRERIKKLRDSYMNQGVMKLQQNYCTEMPEEIRNKLVHMLPAIRGLVAVTKQFLSAFGEQKREKGILDFSDMEHFALQILVEHEQGDRPSEVAKELQDYYQEIMIDEYQDSSYIQETLLSSLCRADQGKRPYLFMVGDVKQSIYRFRQARPELFNAKYEAFSLEDGPNQKINLHQNFRSRGMVLDSANYLFRRIMQKCLGGIVYDQAAELVQGADFGETGHRIAGKSQVLLIRETLAKIETATEAAPEGAKAPAEEMSGTAPKGEKASVEEVSGTAPKGAKVLAEEVSGAAPEEAKATAEEVSGEAPKGAKVLAEEVSGAAPEEAKATAKEGSGAASKGRMPVEDEIQMDKDTLEASVIGAKIRELVQGEDPLYIRDRDGAGTDGYRPVRYRDIVILLRSPGKLADRYIEALGDMGVPAYTETKTGYFSSVEVETVLNLLRIIDNPRQDIPLASVLTSPFVGLTEDELAQIAVCKGDGLNFWDGIVGRRQTTDCPKVSESSAGAYHYFDEDSEGSIGADQDREPLNENLSEALRARLKPFLERLARYRREAQVKSVYELLCEIYRETGIYDIMSAMPGGEKRAANLELLLQKALDYANTGAWGIFDFVQYIGHLKRAKIDFGEASLTNENMDAVRIMSIHKSKGLEFPVVFLAGITRQFNLMDTRGVIRDNDFGVGVDYVDLENHYKTKMLYKQELARLSLQNTLAEEIRILYVALTRAKELLILTGTVKDYEKKREGWDAVNADYGLLELVSAKCYADWVLPLIYSEEAKNYFEIEVWDRNQLTIGVMEELKDDLTKQEKLQKMDMSACAHPALRQELTAMDEFVYAYEEDRRIPVKLSVSEIKRWFQRQSEETQEYPEVPEKSREYSRLSGVPQKDPEPPEIGRNGHPEPAKAGLQESPKPSHVSRPVPRPAFLSEAKGISSAKRGALYHLAFEHLPYDRLSRDSDLGQIDAWLTELITQGYLTEQERQCLKSNAFRRFLESEIGRRMAAADQRQSLHREQQFMIELSARELSIADSDGAVLVQGIIDAWFEEKDGLVVVDYKTDYISPRQIGRLEERYAAQLACYGRALEMLTGKKLREQIIYSVETGQQLVLPLRNRKDSRDCS